MKQSSLDLRRALDDYNAQQYALARGRAEEVRRRQGPLAGQAAYLQGLCAYQLGADEEARGAFTEAAAKTTGQDSGRARAGLGLVALRQGRAAEAAQTLRAAAADLQGEEARQAAAWAARAAQAPGGKPSMPEAPGTFTIQVGAFHGRPHAERAAQTAEQLGERCGVAPVRIVQRDDNRGGTLFVVQLGRFGSRDEASDARKRVGNLQYIVASMGG